MRVIVFGATGLLGQGVLETCLKDDAVSRVLVIGRRATSRMHPKLREIVHGDFTNYSSIAEQLIGYDACFFCLGVSALGMSEDDYRTITYDITLAAARTLVAANPDLTFCYVSGAGTDTREKSRLMWARVKGRTENALLALVRHAYMFRPGAILPMPGTKAATPAYAALYRVLMPVYPVLRRIIPNHITTTRQLGQAMIEVTRAGAARPVLSSADINMLAVAYGESS